MHFSKLSLLAIGATAVDAFKDTSPFFYFSTSETLATSSHVQTAEHLMTDVSSKLSTCPSTFYVVVSQPGVHASDYASRRSSPRLRDRVMGKDESVRSSFTVSEVSGSMDVGHLEGVLKQRCGADKTTVQASTGDIPSEYAEASQVITVLFDAPSDGAKREQDLADNDGFLEAIINQLPSPDYTVVYTTGPRDWTESEGTEYEMDEDIYQNPLRIELKRDYTGQSARADDEDSNLPLFAKYQFLSPGIFMGLLAGLILLFILYIGISALGSLQVSYAAFDKENGPAGQQKKQQ